MKTTMLGLVTAGVLALPATGLAADPVATAIRVGDHAGFVRVVVDRTVTPPLAEFAVASEIADGTAVVDVPRTRIGSVRSVRAFGLTITPTQRGRTLRLTLRSDAFRFKYYSDSTLSRRVVLDLWKARPVYPAATIRDAGCLAITTASPGTGRISARGVGRGIFENQFSLVVRNSAGRIVGRRNGVFINGFPNGTWSTSVAYTVVRRQIGTLEAVDFGGRVGHLCIAQIPAILRPN